MGYLARAPQDSTPWPHDERAGSFLAEAPRSAPVRRLYDDDLDDVGFVMNASRLWAHLPDQLGGLFGLMQQAVTPAGLTLRERGIIVTAAASTLGDSYFSLAWGKKLAGFADPELAGAVLTGTDQGLSEAEQALATWTRRVADDPNATIASDVDGLREAGRDRQILAITLFIALRLAFSTVNDALGASPDRQLGDSVPPPVRNAVTWGRPVED